MKTSTASTYLTLLALSIYSASAAMQAGESSSTPSTSDASSSESDLSSLGSSLNSTSANAFGDMLPSSSGSPTSGEPSASESNMALESGSSSSGDVPTPNEAYLHSGLAGSGTPAEEDAYGTGALNAPYPTQTGLYPVYGTGRPSGTVGVYAPSGTGYGGANTVPFLGGAERVGGRVAGVVVVVAGVVGMLL